MGTFRKYLTNRKHRKRAKKLESKASTVKSPAPSSARPTRPQTRAS